MNFALSVNGALATTRRQWKRACSSHQLSPLVAWCFSCRREAVVDYLLLVLGAEFTFRLKPILHFVTRRPIPRNIYFVCPLPNPFGRWLAL